MVHSSSTIAMRDDDFGGYGDEALGSPSTGLDDDEIDRRLGTCLLGRYRLEQVLGAGGSSVIYRGVHTTIGRTVAVKLLRPELVRNDETVARFLREGRAACRIRHEHVVEATDFGVTPEGDVFLVMEYLEGEDLADLIEREGALPWPRARAIALQICEAIDAAHAADVIHRDITLQNCFRVHREHNPDYVKVIDFGIAKMPETAEPMADEVGVTGNAEIFGTPEYMAPEQVRRTIDADARTDVYALGVVLYALVTGRLPVRGVTALDTLVRQIYEPIEPPSRIVADLPAPLEAVILRALAKDPEDRFQTMAELADALEAVPAVGIVGDRAELERAATIAVQAPIGDLSLGDHDLGAEIPAERLIGVGRHGWLGPRGLAAAAAAALVLVGVATLGRDTSSAPTEVVQAAIVPAPTPVRVEPTPAKLEAAPARVEARPIAPATLRDHGIAVADVDRTRARASKPVRRSARPVEVVRDPEWVDGVALEPVLAEPPTTPRPNADDVTTRESSDEHPDTDVLVPAPEGAHADEPTTKDDDVESSPQADESDPYAPPIDDASEDPLGAPQ